MLHEFQASHKFLEELNVSLKPQHPFMSQAKAIFQRIDKIIDKASLSIDIPETSPCIKEQMLRIEHFLAEDWSEKSPTKGILAVHVDEVAQVTILQIGVAQHGSIYLTVPRVLRPDDVALNSLRELVTRMGPFRNIVDPMAVIDGSHQGLNYNELFKNSRVIRAPSGNTSRLAVNLSEVRLRDRLSPQNTVIINSAPSTREAYLRVFPADQRALHWQTWGAEAQLWDSSVSNQNFTTLPLASRDTFITGLTQKENVIVLVAHCDGETLFMPDPPPSGTTITADYLFDHQYEIAANRPFIYLFSCEAGNLKNVQNFASTLLECGAAGVVASQTLLGADEGRTLLERLLDQNRGTPPVEDFWRATRELNFFEMEVFLA
jgi:hypothetical protein